jgi:hypothetical protein
MNLEPATFLLPYMAVKQMPGEAQHRKRQGFESRVRRLRASRFADEAVGSQV